MKKGNAIFSFTLKNKEGQSDSWHIDLKDKGVVAKGEAPDGKKADGEFPDPFCRAVNDTFLPSTAANMSRSLY